MGMEFLVSPSPCDSIFCGKKLADHPLFVSSEEKNRDRIIAGIESLNFNGWRKIKFYPEWPLESVVVGDNEKTAQLKNFALRIRGPLADFMKKAAQAD